MAETQTAANDVLAAVELRGRRGEVRVRYSYIVEGADAAAQLRAGFSNVGSVHSSPDAHIIIAQGERGESFLISATKLDGAEGEMMMKLYSVHREMHDWRLTFESQPFQVLSLLLDSIDLPRDVDVPEEGGHADHQRPEE